MTNLRAGFSAIAALAIFTFMGFAPGALAEGRISSTTGSASVALSHAPTGLLVLVPASEREHPCVNPDKGKDQHGGCTAVPEGGTTLLYLLVAGLCCVATAVFSMRPGAQIRETE